MAPMDAALGEIPSEVGTRKGARCVASLESTPCPVKNYEPHSVPLSLQGDRTYLSLWAES